MSFTLTNPGANFAAQSMYQTGQNFGGGLGDSLIKYIQNKRFNESLGTITPETPLNEVLQKFAQNQVSPQDQQRYLDPAVLQRMGNQQASKIINESLKTAKTPQEIAQAVMRAQAASGNQFDPKMLMDYAMVNSMFGQNGQGSSQGQVQQPGMQQGQSPSISQQPQVQGGIGNEQTFENIPQPPQIKPYNDQEMRNIRAEKIRQWGNIQRGTEEADREIAQRKAEYENQITKQQLDKGYQEAQLAHQNQVKAAVQEKMGAVKSENSQYVKGLDHMLESEAINNPKYRNLSPEQRAERVWRDLGDPIINARAAFANNIKPSNFTRSLGNEQKIRNLKALTPRFEEYKAKFPKEYEYAAYDTAREDLRSNPYIGAVSADWVVAPPSGHTIAQLKKIGRYHDANMRVKIQGPEKPIQDRKKIANIISQAYADGESPVVIKDLVVDGLGYDDNFYRDAESDAKALMADRGLAVPRYNSTVLNDTLKSWGENPYDYFGGRNIVPAGELYK